MRRRVLSDEERALWRTAVRDVVPEKRGAKVSPPHQGPDRTAPVRHRRPPAETPRVQRSAPAHSVYEGGDPRLDRRVARGRIAIERTLDLHGLRQDDARRRLSRCLATAARDSVLLVLVITGKGRTDDGRSRGVLRARFLDWIEEEPLRGAIARVSPASRQDGGAGAFYVFLKKKGARKSPRP